MPRIKIKESPAATSTAGNYYYHRRQHNATHTSTQIKKKRLLLLSLGCQRFSARNGLHSFHLFYWHRVADYKIRPDMYDNVTLK